MKQLKAMQKKGKALLNKTVKAVKGSMSVVPAAAVVGAAAGADLATTLVVAGGVTVALAAVSFMKK